MNPFTYNDVDIYTPIHLALAIMEKEERIIVGKETEIFKKLSGDDSGVLYYDKNRPIGAFLSDFEIDVNGDWPGVIFTLQEALELRMSYRGKKHADRLEQNALEFLIKKFETDNPVNQYIALEVWFQYLRMCQRKKRENRETASSNYQEYCERLIYPLIRGEQREIEKDTELTQDNGLFHWTRNRPLPDMHVMVVYPTNKIDVEFAYTVSSLLGLKAYYAEKMKIRKRYVIECAFCGRLFLATNRGKLLCCRDCEKRQAQANRQHRRENIDKLNWDRLRNRENNYWANCANKLICMPSVSKDCMRQLTAIQNEFKNQQKVQRERLYNKEISFNELRVWFLNQRDIIDGFIRDNEFG